MEGGEISYKKRGAESKSLNGASMILSFPNRTHVLFKKQGITWP